jgi:hypothetical protein
MTRRHFISLAWELRQARLAIDDAYPIETDEHFYACLTWERCVAAVARACREANPRFQSGRFFEAAGLGRRPDGSMYPMAAPR